MEVKIGVQHVNRELVLESTESSKDIAAAVAAAMGGSPTLELTDERGRVIVVPSSAVAYVEIGADEVRKVGFGTS